MRKQLLFLPVCVVLLLLSACARQEVSTPPSETYTVNLNPTDYVEVVDNPYFPLIPGTKGVYEGQTKDGLERKLQATAGKGYAPRNDMVGYGDMLADLDRQEQSLFEKLTNRFNQGNNQQQPQQPR